MTPDTSGAVEGPAEKAGLAGVDPAGPPPPPGNSPISAKAKTNNIRVSLAVLDAAGKDGDELLRSLHTAPAGLTEADAEARARTAGPNEVAQQRPRGWFIRLLIIQIGRAHV